MSETDNIHYVRVPGSDVEMPVVTVTPAADETDDSARLTLGLGFGEPLEHSIQVARVLADTTGHPVTTYERQRLAQNPHSSAISWGGRNALDAADAYSEAQFSNATTRIVTVHSLGGHAVGHLVGEQPDRFGIIQLSKAIGTTNICPDESLTYLEQLEHLDEKTPTLAGLYMLFRFTNPTHLRSVLPHVAGGGRELSAAARHGLKEFTQQWGADGLRQLLSRVATSRFVDVAPSLREARKRHARIGAVGDKKDRIINSRDMRRSLVERGLVDDFELVDTGHIPLAAPKGLDNVREMGAQITRLQRTDGLDRVA